MIEHVALNVSDPAGMADWWCRHLDMRVLRHNPGPPIEGFFLADAAGRTVLELYANPSADVLDFPALSPLQLHLAFASNDVPADYARLVAAGATPAREPYQEPNGDAFAMLRDPWGVAVQLVSRAVPLMRDA